MHAIKQLGLKCPKDVSVVGFDDFDWSQLFSPRLTTMVQPSYKIGESAAELLVQVMLDSGQRLDGDKSDRIVLKAEMRIGESTAPVGG
jgi:LacI family transcriptional regulator